MPVSVRTPVFEGPFDLLLHLILSEEVDLWEVSLTEIVDAYLNELDRMGVGSPGASIDLETATQFLLIAATLVELKSRRLLPDPASDALDEDLALWEERDLLLARLIECKTFKNVSTDLARRMVDASRSFPRTAGVDERYLGLAPDLMAGIEARDLAEAMARAARPRESLAVTVDHIAPIRASVADALVQLVEILPSRRTVTFGELVEGMDDRIQIVVRFLGVLELFKEGFVELEQATSFATLVVRWQGGDVTADDVLVGADDYDG